jgi:hypothetical protein
MNRPRVSVYLIVAAIGMAAWAGGFVAPLGLSTSPVFAAATLNVEGLPEDPTAYRESVKGILDQTDRLIGKLKEDPSKEVVALELIQARDNVYQEAYKIDHFPEGATWTAEEARANTDAMLKHLKTEYDKASEAAEAAS